MPQALTQYRRATGNHVNWSDKQQGSQKKQNEYLQRLAAQPGNHAGNRDWQQIAHAAVQLLSFLSSVQNTHTCPAIAPARANRLATEEIITHADNLYSEKRVERASNREVMRNAGHNLRPENATRTQDGSFCKQARPANGPLSSALPAFVTDNVIPPLGSGYLVQPASGGNTFSTMLNPVANALYETGKFIARHDPLRFPAADAAPMPLAGKKSTTYDGNCELQKNDEGKYAIIIHKYSGVKLRIPVYMDPLSKTWHPSVCDGSSVFNDEQKETISKIKEKQEDGFYYVPRGNNNQNYYGNGNIYVQEKIGDTGHYPWRRYIEMNGELVPVRNTIHQGAGVLYEVYDVKNPSWNGHPVEWDGNRWLFERKTSECFADDVKRKIDQSIFYKNLSEPDHVGLRKDVNGDVYINIDGGMVKLNVGNTLKTTKKPEVQPPQNHSEIIHGRFVTCAGAGLIFSCSVEGWGAIEVKIKGAFGIGVLAGTAYVNKSEIEKNFSSGNFYSNSEISGGLIMGLLYSRLTGYSRTGGLLFEINVGGFGSVGGGTLVSVSFDY